MSKEGPKDSFEVIIDLAYILLYELKKLIYSLLLKVKQQELIKSIVVGELFWKDQCLLNDFMWY